MNPSPRLRRAAKIFEAGEGTISLPAAMKAAGYPEEEQKNRTLQQRLRRYHIKAFPPAPPAAAIDPPPAASVAVRKAARIFEACEATISIPAAMKAAGYSAEEQKNPTLQQRVRRYRIKAFPPDPPAPPVTSPSAPPVTVGGDNMSFVSALTTSPPRAGASRAAAAGKPSWTRKKPPPPSNVVTRSAKRKKPRTPALPTAACVQSTSQLAAGKRNWATLEAGFMQDKMTEKKRRRSSSQKRADDAKLVLQWEKEKEARKMATLVVNECRKLPKGHPKKQSTQTIVDTVNKKFGTSLHRRTIDRCVNNGLIGESAALVKRGSSGHFDDNIYQALLGSYTTFLKLEQADTNTQSKNKAMEKRFEACVTAAGYNISVPDLVARMRRDSAPDFETGKANKAEQQRVLPTYLDALDKHNKLCCDILSENGFDSSHLRRSAPPVRQAEVARLAAAPTAPLHRAADPPADGAREDEAAARQAAQFDALFTGDRFERFLEDIRRGLVPRRKMENIQHAINTRRLQEAGNK